MLSTIRRQIPMKWINMIHVLLFGITLVYVGLKKERTPSWVHKLFYVYAACIPLLVGFPSFSLGYWQIIKWAHYLVLLPFFIYLGYQTSYSNEAYQGLLGMGVLLIIYHCYKFFIRMKR